MKRITSILFVTLVAVFAYAQKSVLRNPVPFKAEQTQLKAAGNTRTVAKPTSSRRRAASDFVIITDQPAGELLQFTRSGNYLYVQDSKLYIGSQSGTVSVVSNGDNYYIQDPLMDFSPGTWVEGHVKDGKLVVPVPQNLYYVSDYDACIAIIPINAYSSADTEATEITYTISKGDNDRLVFTLDGFTSYNRTLGAYWTDDESIQLYGEYNTVFTQVLDGESTEPQVVEAPEDLVVEEYSMTYGTDGTGSVKVGFDGDDVYIQGFSTYLTEAWVKGTLEGNTVTFASDQYYGPYGSYVSYFSPAAYGGGDVVFTYDADAEQFVSQNTIFGVISNSEGAYYDGNYAAPVILTKVKEKAATPANPAITAFANSSYGYYFDFNVPTVDVDGNGLITSKLFFVIYTDTEHDIQPLTFTPATHELLTDDLTEIPYGFTEGYDFYNGEIYLNGLYSADWNKIGIKSIYYGGDETNETEIQWYDIKDYATVLSTNTVDNQTFYTTFYSKAGKFKADANTTVYYARYNSTRTHLTLSTVTSKIIPSGTAVILESSSPEIKLSPTTSTARISGNVLQGVAEDTEVEAGSVYVLGAKDGVVGFYQFTGTTLEAGKAYLPVTNAAVKAFYFEGDGDATGINEVKDEELRMKNDSAVFNLAGQRVSKAQKGINIVNGKKFIVK